MDTWTLQMGFPVVNVTRDYDSNEATLIQVKPQNKPYVRCEMQGFLHGFVDPVSTS